MPEGRGRPKVKAPCPTCNGTGTTKTRVNVTEIWERECPVCNGTGEVEEIKAQRIIKAQERAKRARSAYEVGEDLEKC